MPVIRSKRRSVRKKVLPQDFARWSSYHIRKLTPKEVQEFRLGVSGAFAPSGPIQLPQKQANSRVLDFGRASTGVNPCQS